MQQCNEENISVVLAMQQRNGEIFVVLAMQQCNGEIFLMYWLCSSVMGKIFGEC